MRSSSLYLSPSSRSEMNFNWITLSNNEWSNATFVHHGTKVYIRLDGILSGIYYFGSGSQCQSGLVISKDQHTPRIMQPLRPFHHDSVDSASANFGFLRLGDRPRPLYPPKTLTIPLLEQHNAYRGGKTTLCGTRGEIAFMANRSRALLWTVVVIVWFIWKLETAVSRPTFDVISLPRCTIILLKGNSIRIFDFYNYRFETKFFSIDFS